MKVTRRQISPCRRELRLSCEQVEQIDDHRADHNNLHQIGDAEAGMLIAKFIDFAVDAVQKNTPPNTAENGRSKCADFPIRLILHENRLRVIKKL